MSNGNKIFSVSMQNAHLNFIIHNESFVQKHTEKWQKVLHAHVYYEILVSLNDANKLILEKKELPFENGVYAIVKPYQNHGTFLENVADLISIGFYYEPNKNTEEKNDVCLLMDKLLASKNIICKSDNILSKTFMKLRNLSTSDDPISEGLITSLLLQIFYNILFALDKQADDTQSNEQATLSNRNHLPRRNSFELLCMVNDLLNARYMEDITPESLSHELYISPKQINRYIFSLYNQTFLQRRTTLRITAAQKRLRESTASIAEISATVGYNSINTFYSAFKTFCGMTPDKYRYSNNRLT